jgi:large subunit ribosomal protein L4
MKVPVYSLTKEQIKEIEVSDDVFGLAYNEAVIHQAMLRQRADARQGTAKTKTRGEVAGAGRKLFRQKHTGFARAGSLRSPIRRKGGRAHGPRPRDYRQAMPKKMRQLALKSLLSAKLASGSLLVLEQLEMAEPKTKEMAGILNNFGAIASALIATAEPKENLIKSARNIPGVKTITANLLNVVDLLDYRQVLMTESAVRKVEALWGKSASQGDNGVSL